MFGGLAGAGPSKESKRRLRTLKASFPKKTRPAAPQPPVQ